MDKADAQRLSGIKTLCREEVAVCGARPHGADDVGADGGRNQPQLHFAEAKTCRVHAHRHVARGYQAHATGVHITLHAGNGGFGALENHTQHVGELACVGQVLVACVVGHAAHPVQVGASAKGRAFGGQHHDAHVRARTHLQKGGGDVGNHLIAEGVAHFGLGEGDGGAVAVVGQGKGCHACLPYMRKTPNLVSSMGALRAADRPSARTRRVSTGSITPSSHKRALA